MTLESPSALDPSSTSHNVMTHLEKLSKSGKHLLTEEVGKDFHKDTRALVNDRNFYQVSKSQIELINGGQERH